MIVSKVMSYIPTQPSGALLNTISLDASDMVAAYQCLKNNVLKELTQEGIGLRRQKRWIEAAKKFETAGQYYSAMFCLHKAIDAGQGIASDNFKELSSLYHKVGRHNRAKRYSGYADYELAKENVSYTRKFMKERGVEKDIREFSRDVGDMVYDDHDTFRQNLEEYVKEERSKAPNITRGGLLCLK